VYGRFESAPSHNARQGVSEPDFEPPYLFPDYRATRLRAPRHELVRLPEEWFHNTRGPAFGRVPVTPGDADLTKQHAGEPLGERIILTGRVLDGDGRPVRRALVEVWQANAAGRYVDPADAHPAPLDPNFTGAGRCLTDGDGVYRFVTVKPGAYPWRNHANAWRPAHVHFSLFGPMLSSRLVTQMYFPGDPLIPLDPILNSIADPRGRGLLVASFDPETTEPEWALAYRWDIVLRGHNATPVES
jgi:protocatechuate 3,4-dioxygenase, beta subunit